MRRKRTMNCVVRTTRMLFHYVCVTNGFFQFRSGKVSIGDAPRSERPIVIENDPLKQTISRHLKKNGYPSNLNVWVPHQLTEDQLTHRISTRDLSLKRLINDPFLKKEKKRNIIDEMGMKSGLLTARSRGKDRGGTPLNLRKQPAKAGLHPKKILLSNWWHWQ